MGLPGAGKTTLADALAKKIEFHGDCETGNGANEST